MLYSDACSCSLLLHTVFSPTRSVLVVLVQCYRAPAASCLGWTFRYVRLGKKGAMGLAQSRLQTV